MRTRRALDLPWPLRPLISLQWSRVRENAERGRNTSSARLASTSFNGAAFVRTRRELYFSQPGEYLYLLQWSRVRENAER